MNVTIFGSGYVGLVAAACFADVGNQVLCVDVDAQKVARLQAGEVPIYEPGLSDILARNAEEGRIRYTTDLESGVTHGVVQFIAVGTPSDEDGSADLKYVVSVARTIGQYMNKHTVVVDKSTVPVGTGDIVEQTIKEALKKRAVMHQVSVVSNPEFLREGSAIADFVSPDRVVIGTDEAKAREAMATLYAPFNQDGSKVIFMSRRSAELAKYAANGLLATKISFINEIANIAEAAGADVESVRQAIGMDKRIGPHFIQPGCGYGGSCFPKDVRALAKTAEEVGAPCHILQAVQEVNERQKQTLFQKLTRHLKGDLSGKVIAVWGLAFKPNTDDMREAPSCVLIESCLRAGMRVQAYDPKAMPVATKRFSHDSVRLCAHAYAALEGADALVIVTEWSSFRQPDFERLKKSLKQPLVIDGRNLYTPEHMTSLGFTYESVGR